jgi:hypothetical protein
MKFVIAITLSFFTLFANAAGFGYVTNYSSVAEETLVSVTGKLVNQQGYAIIDKVVDSKIIHVMLHNPDTKDSALVSIEPKHGKFIVTAVSKNNNSIAVRIMQEEIPSYSFEIKGVTRVVKN